MSTSNRGALLMVLPHTLHRAHWCHPAVDAWEDLLTSLGRRFGERSPVFANGKLKIREQRWNQGEVPGVPLSQVSAPALPHHQH